MHFQFLTNSIGQFTPKTYLILSSILAYFRTISIQNIQFCIQVFPQFKYQTVVDIINQKKFHTQKT